MQCIKVPQTILNGHKAPLCITTTKRNSNKKKIKQSKYFTTHKSEWLDDNGNLKPEFDAARAIMGGDWRMPTKADFDELLRGTTNEWATNYNGTGVNGYKFTSKTNTSKYIFIPAAGVREDSSSFIQGFNGNVWSSSLYTSTPYNAWSLLFGDEGCYMSRDSRYFGQSVRGVL